jgi:hypothetical protein
MDGGRWSSLYMLYQTRARENNRTRMPATICAEDISSKEITSGGGGKNK